MHQSNRLLCPILRGRTFLGKSKVKLTNNVATVRPPTDAKWATQPKDNPFFKQSPPTVLLSIINAPCTCHSLHPRCSFCRSVLYHNVHCIPVLSVVSCSVTPF